MAENGFLVFPAEKELISNLAKMYRGLDTFLFKWTQFYKSKLNNLCWIIMHISHHSFQMTIQKNSMWLLVTHTAYLTFMWDPPTSLKFDRVDAAIINLHKI